jgi:hypothetical protein
MKSKIQVDPDEKGLPPMVAESGRIAVKVINHLGDEVMKVFRVTP